LRITQQLFGLAAVHPALAPVPLKVEVLRLFWSMV
jgi:hypothetical protein